MPRMLLRNTLVLIGVRANETGVSQCVMGARQCHNEAVRRLCSGSLATMFQSRMWRWGLKVGGREIRPTKRQCARLSATSFWQVRREFHWCCS